MSERTISDLKQKLVKAGAKGSTTYNKPKENNSRSTGKKKKKNNWLPEEDYQRLQQVKKETGNLISSGKVGNTSAVRQLLGEGGRQKTTQPAAKSSSVEMGNNHVIAQLLGKGSAQKTSQTSRGKQSTSTGTGVTGASGAVQGTGKTDALVMNNRLNGIGKQQESEKREAFNQYMNSLNRENGVISFQDNAKRAAKLENGQTTPMALTVNANQAKGLEGNANGGYINPQLSNPRSEWNQYWSQKLNNKRTGGYEPQNLKGTVFEGGIEKAIHDPDSVINQRINEYAERIKNGQRPVKQDYSMGSFANNNGTVNEALQAGNVETTSKDMRWMIEGGYYNNTAGTDYNLMNATGRTNALNSYKVREQELLGRITYLEDKVAAGQAQRPQTKEEYHAWREASMPTILRIYHTPETKNERTILARENASDAEKQNAQNTLDQLLYVDRDENGDSAYDRANHLIMDDTEQLRDMWHRPGEGKREDAREYVYDYMNGEGAYDRDMADLDAEGQDALRGEIDDAIGYLIDTNYEYERELQTAQAELRYTQGEIGKLERMKENDKKYRLLFDQETTGNSAYNVEEDRTIGATMGAVTEADQVYHMLGGGYDPESNYAGLYQSGNGYGLALLMDQKERDYFISLYNDHKYDEAQAFYDALKPTLTQYGNVWENLYLKQQATTNPVTSSALTVGAHVLQVPEMIYGGIARLAGDQNAYDPYGGYFELTRYKTGIRSAVGENIENSGLGKAGKIVYDAIMSGADSWANLHLWNFAGESKLHELGTLAMFFAQSYETDLQQNLIETHGDVNRSRLAALTTATIETATEVISVEKLMSDPSNMRQWVKKVILSEAGEEIEGAAFGPLINEIVTGHNEWKDRAIQIVGQGGYADENGNWIKIDNYDDAWRIASKEWIHDIFLSGLSGALSVLGSAGYGVSQNAVRSNRLQSIGENVNNYRQGNMKLNGPAQEVTRGPQLQTELDVINNPQLSEEAQEQGQRQAEEENQQGNSQETTEEKKSGLDLLLEAAGKLKSDSRSAKLAESIRQDQKYGKKISNYRIGELAVSLAQESDAGAQEIAKSVMAGNATSSLKAQGLTDGKSGELGYYIGTALTSPDGLDALSKQARKKLEGSEAGMLVYNQLRNAIEDNTEGGKSLQDQINRKSRAMWDVSDTVEEVAGRKHRGVEVTTTSGASVGEQYASEDDILQTGQQATRSADEVIVDGKMAKITGVTEETVESKNGKKTQLRYTIEQDGQTRTVTASELKATSFATAAVIRQGEVNSGIYSARYVNQMLKQMQRGNVTDVGSFMTDALRIRLRAYTGRTMPETNLPRSVAAELYTDAVNERKEELDNLPANRTTRGAGNGVARLNGTEFGTDSWNQEVQKITNKQLREEVEYIAQVAKAAGIEVDLYENTEDQGEWGSEDDRTGRIRINLSGLNYALNPKTRKAEATGRHSIVVSFSHEFTHWLKQNAPEAYKRLMAYELNALEEKGFDVAKEALDMYEHRKKHEKGFTLSMAIDELVSEASDSVLSNEQVARHIQETDKKLAGKIREFVRDLVDRVKKVIPALTESQSKYSRGLKDHANEINRLWLGAYDEALSGQPPKSEQTNNNESYKVRESRSNIQTPVFSNGIEMGMTDAERYNAIKGTRIQLEDSTSLISVDEASQFNGLSLAKAKQEFTKFARKLGVIGTGNINKTYRNKYLTNKQLIFSHGGLDESLQHQKGGRANLAALMPVFEETLREAVPIMMQGDRYEKALNSNNEVDAYAILLGGFKYGNSIIPVEFEIKHYESSMDNGLYVVATMRKDAVKTAGPSAKNGMPAARASLNISIEQLIDYVNPTEDKLLSVIPAQFLTKAQLAGKRRGLNEQGEYINDKVTKEIEKGTAYEGVKNTEVFNVTESRIDNAITEAQASGKNTYMAYINPTDFVDLTAVSRQHVENEGRPMVASEIRSEETTPMIEIDSETGLITDNDGKQRLNAMAKAGVQKVAVLIRDNNSSAGANLGQVKINGQNGNSVMVSGMVAVDSANRQQLIDTFSTSDSWFRYSRTSLDQEYADAVERGDIQTATDLLMDKLANTEGITAFNAPWAYSGQYRDIAKLLKNGTPEAVAKAATDMAKYVPENAVLIPMPDHTGKVNENTDTMILARAISELTGRPVVAALEGNNRESRHGARLEGRQAAGVEELGFRQAQEIPEGTMPIFIDNVVTSGVTANAAEQAMGGGITLAYAKHMRTQGIQGLKRATITYDRDENLIPLSERFNREIRDVNYSRANIEYMKPFGEQVDDFMNPEIDNRKVFGKDSLLVGKAPKTFLDIDLPNLPLTINQEHVGYALNGNYPKDAYKEGHMFTPEEFKKLPDKVAKPIAICYDPSSTKQVIIYVDMTNKTGNQVIVPLRIGGISNIGGRRINALKLETAFAHENGKKMLESAIRSNSNNKATLFYIDTEKAAASGLGDDIITIVRGLDSGLIHSIKDPASSVKLDVEDQTDTLQFKNWFKGSKIVDENNKPLVVYHGTDAKFTVFEMDRTRSKMDLQGAFFSPYEEDESGYGENVGAFYLSIKNPAPESKVYAALNRFAGQENASVKATRYLEAQGYDGADMGGMEYIAFHAEQVKSATENIGTFDKKNPDYRYSRANIDRMDVQTWMEGLDEYSLRSEDERELLKSYKNLRMKIKVSQQKQLDYRKKIQRLEASREVLTPAERSELIETRNRLDIEEGKYARLETQLYEVTDSEGYASMMYYQNQVLNDFLYGRTQAQVDQTVSGMLDEVKKMRGEIAKQAEELKALSEDKAVRTVKSRMAQTQLREMAQVLQNELSSRMGLKEVESRLAEIALKNAQGKDVTADCEALARDMADKARGMSDKTEELEAIRGTVFVIGPKQLEELHAMDSTLKEVNQRLRGSGVRVKSGPVSEIERQWRDLRESNMGLPELYAEGDMLETVVSWVESQMNRSAIAEYGGFDASEYMPVVLACATAIQVEALGDETDARQARMLMGDVKALIGKTENIAENMEKLQQRMDALEEAGHRAAGWTGSLSADVNMALEYYNKTARQAAREERRKVKEELIKSLQSDHAKELVAQEQKFRDLMRQDRDARNLRADNDHLRSQIHMLAKRMATLLTKETDLKNIPEQAKPLARYFLKMIVDHDLYTDFRRVTLSGKEGLKEMAKRLKSMEMMDGEVDLNRDLEWLVVGEGENRDEEVRDTVISDLIKIEQGLLEWDHADGLKNISLADRKAALLKIREGAAEIMNVINRSQQVEINGRRYQILDIAQEVHDGMAGSRFKGELTGDVGRKMAKVKEVIGYGNTTPEYFFRNLRNKALSMLHGEMHRAENRNGLLLREAQKSIAKIVEETGAAEWDMKQKVTLYLESGQNVEMTLGQVMGLWATWNREKMNQEETKNGVEQSFHLKTGGFYVEQENSGKGVKRELIRQRAHKVTDNDMTQVGMMLTPAQREYVERMVGYLSKDMSDLGNEASMRMYGIKKYKEAYYYPFKIWEGVKSVKSDAGAGGTTENRIAHSSFSKRRVSNASNALVIGDFTETVANHVVQMINYNTFAPAIEGLNKVMNTQLLTRDGAIGATKRNVWAAFGEAYGRDALGYLQTFLKDLNGGVTQDKRKTLKENLLSVFKKNAVAGSMSVAAQQPLSYIRAAMLINPKYLSLAINPKYWKGSHEEMLKYSGVAVIKEMGRFDMGYGQSAREYLLPEGKVSKARAVGQKISEYSTILPEKMDQMTWTRMWTACKLEQQELNPGMDTKSDAFLEKVAERFNEVMRRTQVYDSVLVKSSNMRSQNFSMKALTSFMAEPTLTINVLADAYLNRNEKGGKMFLAKALGLFLMSAAAQAAVKGFFGAGRSPDDKKTKEENFWYRFWYNFISEVNPLGLIPGYNDAVELLANGELKDDAAGVVGKALSIFKTVSNMAQGKGKGAYRDIEDSLGQLLQLATNVPLKNIMRDGRAMFNWFSGAPYAQRETSGSVMKYQMIDLLASQDLLGLVNGWLGDAGYNTNTAHYYERIYQAKKAGNDQAAAEMTEYLTLGKGVKENVVQQNVAKQAKADENASAAETAEFLMGEGGNVRDYTLDQYKEGEISRDEAARILKQNNPEMTDDDIFWTLDRADFKKETGAEEVSGKNYRFYDAIENGGSAEIKKAAAFLKEHGVDLKKQRGSLTTRYKKEYLELKPASAEQVKMKNQLIMAYKETGMTEQEAEQLINKWKK